MGGASERRQLVVAARDAVERLGEVGRPLQDDLLQDGENERKERTREREGENEKTTRRESEEGENEKTTRERQEGENEKTTRRGK